MIIRRAAKHLNETSLPPKKAFYSKLNLEYITEKDYNDAQKLWEVCCTDIADYHDLYVECDTLLLAGVFEKFRDTCIDIYELDPAHFLSAPGLSWQACLRKQK